MNNDEMLVRINSAIERYNHEKQVINDWYNKWFDRCPVNKFGEASADYILGLNEEHVYKTKKNEERFRDDIRAIMDEYEGRVTA